MQQAIWGTFLCLLACAVAPARDTTYVEGASKGLAASLPEVEVQSTPAERAPLAGNGPYLIRRWTTEQGLPQGRIACLKQTRDGFLWMGTWTGLTRFDGRRFTTFDRLNTPQITQDAITALAEDSSGTLWIGTRDAIIAYRDRTFRRISKAEGLPVQSVWRLEPSRNGGIWINCDDSVAMFKDGKFSCVQKLLGPGNSVKSLSESSNGSLDIFLEDRWLTLAPSTGRLETNCQVKVGEAAWLATARPDGEGDYWIGRAKDGLCKLDQRGALTVPGQCGRLGSVDLVFTDRRLNLWVSSREKGLFRGDGTNWMAVDLGPDLDRETVICMEEDIEGGLWLGTEQGLVQLVPKVVQSFTSEDGLPANKVLSVCEGADKTVWVATDRGLCGIRSGLGVHHVLQEAAAGFPDMCVWPASQGGVLVAKQGMGVYLYDEKKTPPWTTVRVAPGWDLKALYVDSAGRLLVGGSEGVLVLDHGRELTNAVASAALKGYDVRSIFQDRQGDLWFGTRNRGLLRLHNGAVRQFGPGDGLAGTNVWAIHEDARHTLWFGTDHGLNRYADGKFFTIRMAQGLVEDTVNCILEDDTGNLWLSGLRGVHRIRLADLDAVAEGRTASVECFTLGTADGMKNPETNGEQQPSGWKASDGRLWFATTKGVVAIDPKLVPRDEKPPRVVIEEMKAENESMFGDFRRRRADAAHSRTVSDPAGSAAQRLKIAPGRGRMIEFIYTANTFVAPERGRFRTRVIGLDEEWRESSSSEARYFNIDPGDYAFEVIAANHHNVWNTQPARIEFTIEPHFWETWVFYALCAAAVIGLAAAIQAYRMKWLRRLLKVEEQRALASERGRIARDLHDDLGSSLTGLALRLESARSKGQAGKEELASLALQTQMLTRELRELLWTTSPRCDDGVSLTTFLADATDRFCQAAGLACQVSFPGEDWNAEVPSRVRYEVLAVLKESLANTAKHARASRVKVGLTALNGTLTLTVQDDGIGFDSSILSDGFGLRNLQERAQLAGGTFMIESKPGHGTRTTATLPLHPKQTGSD